MRAHTQIHREAEQLIRRSFSLFEAQVARLRADAPRHMAKNASPGTLLAEQARLAAVGDVPAVLSKHAGRLLSEIAKASQMYEDAAADGDALAATALYLRGTVDTLPARIPDTLKSAATLLRGRPEAPALAADIERTVRGPVEESRRIKAAFAEKSKMAAALIAAKHSAAVCRTFGYVKQAAVYEKLVARRQAAYDQLYRDGGRRR